MKEKSPEEFELNKKRQVLERLESRLAQSEEEIIGFREELKIFAARYTQEVARFYTELDELEAEIAKEEARLAPDDLEIQRKAFEARERAAQSAASNAEETWQSCSHKFNPSPHLKNAYRRLARLIHPDLAVSAEEREKRNLLMAQANNAFAAGDENILFGLLSEYRDSPDLIKGEDLGAVLVRVIRQIYQIKHRLLVLRKESAELAESENNQLRLKVEAEMQAGRNLFGQMAARTKTNIRRAKRRLDELRQITLVVDFDEHYKMDVSMFR
ncbi:MAG: hypothetical protein ABI954_15660 [Pyrinomonadaceae bacterium]